MEDNDYGVGRASFLPFKVSAIHRETDPLILMGQIRPRFGLFSLHSHDKYSTITINDKSMDSVHGTRTRAAGW